jgi:4-amino-4-deoxy-L-arabinose transferase-like glycosyltransferase
MQTRAIVDFGDLDLNRTMQVYGAVGDLSVYGARYYPSKAPLLSFAAVPVYLGLRAVLGKERGAVPEPALVYFARLFLTVIPTLIALVLIRRFLATYVSLATADAVTLMYALGTLAFSYSLLFMSHQPSAVLLFAAFYGLWRWSRGEWRDTTLLLSGALASAAVLAEYTTAIATFGLGLYGVLTVTRRGRTPGAAIRSAAFFLCGALPCSLLLMWYHTRAFGGPFESGYRHLADRAYQPWHQSGFLGIGLPQPRAFFLSLFSPLRGLFMLSPGLLLSLPGLLVLFRRARSDRHLGPLAWSVLAIVLGYFYFTAAFSYESWGWTTGPRHLTPLVPFLLLPCGLVVERARTSWFRGACGSLLASSVAITSALTFINYIPDDVSNALPALVLPLTRAGFLVPSLPNFLGLGNPLAGIMLWGAVASTIAWLLWSFRPRKLACWLAASAMACVIVLAQVTTYQDSPADRGALTLLKRVWLVKPSPASLPRG